MKVIQHSIKTLSSWELEILYEFAESTVLDNRGSRVKAIHQVNALTIAEQTNNKSFNENNLYALGIQNCCSLFESLCKQYAEYKMYSGKSAKIEQIKQNSKTCVAVLDYRFNVNIGPQCEMIDNIVQRKYNQLKKGTMRNADESTIYYCALYDTFSEMYYQLKDYVKGKSYRDSVFLEKTRKLSSEYEKVSDNLIKKTDLFTVDGMNVEEVREYLLDKLHNGVRYLSKINYQTQKPKEEAKQFIKKMLKSN